MIQPKIYKNERRKIIVPTNGYFMLFMFIAMFFGSIALLVAFRHPLMVLLTVASLLLAFGFVMVQPNNSRVLLLFGEYVGTIKKNGYYWVNPFIPKRKFH